MQVSKAEEIAGSAMRDSIAGLPIGASIDGAPRFQELLNALEWFVTEILGQVHKHWERWEALDGIRTAQAIKTAERQAELIGMCCLIQDQAWTPIHIRLRHAESACEIEWMACRVGARGNGNGGILRIPEASLGKYDAYRVAQDPDAVDWVYTAAFGDEAAGAISEGASQ